MKKPPPNKRASLAVSERSGRAAVRQPLTLGYGSIPARTISTLVAEPNFYPLVVRSFTEHCVCLLNGIEERVSLDFLKGIDGVVSTEKAAAVKHGVSLRSHFYAGQRLPPFEPDRDQDGHDQGERDDYPDERVPAHRWIVGA